MTKVFAIRDRNRSDLFLTALWHLRIPGSQLVAYLDAVTPDG